MTTAEILDRMRLDAATWPLRCELADLRAEVDELRAQVARLQAERIPFPFRLPEATA